MRRDEVIKAITFQGPAYLPIYFFNRDQDQSDIVAAEVQHHFMGPDKNISEWGFFLGTPGRDHGSAKGLPDQRLG